MASWSYGERCVITVMAFALFGCAHGPIRNVQAGDLAGAYVLETIDGRAVGAAGLRMRLDRNAQASFAFDCGESFARYALESARLSFSNHSPTGSGCDGNDQDCAAALTRKIKADFAYHSYRIALVDDAMILSGWHRFKFPRLRGKE